MKFKYSLKLSDLRLMCRIARVTVGDKKYKSTEYYLWRNKHYIDALLSQAESEIERLEEENAKLKYGSGEHTYNDNVGYHYKDCQSTNHKYCRGELWTCECCGKTVCEEEGSDDQPFLCDSCWNQQLKLG